MPNPSIPCSGSPDISTLSYAILYDISVFPASITLTNFSTLIHPTLLTWWYVITTPSGTPIHSGSLASPDVSLGNTWTTLTIPPNTWPLIFGTPPCGQVEFSNNSPYICTLYVKDSVGNTFSLAILQLITSPNGNNQYSCGNFGRASVSIEVQCNNKVVFCNDSTNFAYQNLLQPTSAPTNAWTLLYPQDPNGNQPANGTAVNTPNVSFPIGYSGDGYVLNLRDYASYNMGNGATINIQYKAINPNTGGPGLPFSVLCNIDLCKLQCQIQAFMKLSVKKCGNVMNPELNTQMTRMNLLLWEATTGIMQPLCGIDVPAIIKEIQKIGNLDDNCDCGCTDTGINFNYPLNPGATTGGCCPVSVPIINLTTSPATPCTATVYPVQVLDPTGSVIIGLAADNPSIITILNSNPAWEAIGTFFLEGACFVGCFPVTVGASVPNVYIQEPTSACTGNTQLYAVNLADLCLPTVPITTAFFPLNVFVDFGLGAGPVYVGNVATPGAMIVALNSTPTKPSSITFSLSGTNPAQVTIFNSSCTGYSGTIAITCDLGSSSFLAYGAAHDLELSSPPTINGAVEGYGMHLNALVGKFPGLNSANIQWHIIQIGNYALITESNTGYVYVYNISNPLFPTLAKSVKLTAVSGVGTPNFSGLPLSKGILSGGGSPVKSFYSLYFPTDYQNMVIGSVYVVEAVTGSIWNINCDPTSGTAVISSFYDARLLGKCPRMILSCTTTGGAPYPTLIFTQDGSLEQDASLSSGVASNQIVTLDLNVFNSGGISVLTNALSPSTEYTYAATYDGGNTIWFMTSSPGLLYKGTISPSSGSLTLGSTFYNTATSGAATLRTNIKYYQNNIYISLLYNQGSTGSNAFMINLAVLPTISVTQFGVCPGNLSASNHVNNIIPLGNCLVLVTGEGGDPGFATGTTAGAVMVYKTNGTFIMSCNWQTGQCVYNLLVLGGISAYTPNGLS
jgi:hypothetical protein